MSGTFAKNYQPGEGLVPKWILGMDNVKRLHYVPPDELERPDPVSAEIFGAAPRIAYGKDALHTTIAVFDRKLEPAEWGRLVGGIEGSTVELLGYPGAPASVYATVKHEYFDYLERTVWRIGGSRVAHLDHEAIRKSDDAPYDKLGIRVVAMQIKEATRLGLSHIELYANGHGPSFSDPKPSADNGYYTWAALGFDAVLDSTQPPETLAVIQARLMALGQNMIRLWTLQEVLSFTEDGLEWWRERGGPLKMRFVLDPTGHSYKIMLEYLRRSGIWLP